VPPLPLSSEPANPSELDDSEIPCAVPNPARPSAPAKRHGGRYLDMNSRAQLGICNDYAWKEDGENNGTPPCSCLARNTRNSKQISSRYRKAASMANAADMTIDTIETETSLAEPVLPGVSNGLPPPL